MWTIRIDDLTAEDSRALVTDHLRRLALTSPEEALLALDVYELQDPSVVFFTARRRGRLGGMAAVKRLGPFDGELKSMRTTDDARGQGLGRALLERVIGEAAATGVDTLWLETGAAPEFLPSRSLYESAGFDYCGPFADYDAHPLSVFMRKRISRER